MKKCLAIFIGVALSVSASAQRNQLRIPERAFLQIGGTIGLDYSQFAGTVDGSFNRNQRVVNKQVNYATLAVGGRFNVFEFSNTFSLALAAQPLLSFGKAFNDADPGMNMMFRAPFTIDVNIGNAATNRSWAGRGVVLGAGVQWVKYPLAGDVTIFRGSNSSQTSSDFVNMNSNWWEPVVQLGIRSQRKHFYSNEVNIRAAYVKYSSLNLGDANRALRDFERFSIMLSYLVFLNY